MRQQYLLDTNICVYWLRDKYGIRKRINEVEFDNCCISEITMAELKFGKVYGKLKGGSKYKEQKMDEFFNAIKVLPISPVIDFFAEEKAQLTLAGTPVEDFDLLIGCTAVENNMVLVTQNVKDFKNISNIRIENWIDDEALIAICQE